MVAFTKHRYSSSIESSVAITVVVWLLGKGYTNLRDAVATPNSAGLGR